MRSTNENSYVFNSRDEIYLAFTEKGKFSFFFYTFYRLHAMSRPLKKELLKMQTQINLDPKYLSRSNKENAYVHLMFSFTNKKVMGV